MDLNRPTFIFVPWRFAGALLCSFMLLFFSASPCLAAGYALRFGPPAVGRGGPNPVGLPPSTVDTELSFVTRKGFEADLSVTGLLFGYRAQSKWGGYVSTGGGVVLDANGAGPGLYSSFGMDLGCGWFCFSAEYMRAFGVSGKHTLLPYAVRIGAILWTD